MFLISRGNILHNRASGRSVCANYVRDAGDDVTFIASQFRESWRMRRYGSIVALDRKVQARENDVKLGNISIINREKLRQQFE